MVQILQLRHGSELPELQITHTLPALRHEVTQGLISEADAKDLIAAWTLAMQIRNATMLVRGRAVDMVPTELVEQSRIAQVLGYGVRGGQQMVDDYRKLTRRARAVIQREFYGQES